MSKPDQQELPITIIVCRRGRQRRSAPCSAPNCSEPHTRLCDFPLRGSKAGRTCDAKICDGHATCAGPGKDYCPPHTVLTAKEAELPEK